MWLKAMKENGKDDYSFFAAHVNDLFIFLSHLKLCESREK